MLCRCYDYELIYDTNEPISIYQKIPMPCMTYWSGKLPHLKSKKFDNTYSKLHNIRLDMINVYQINLVQSL